MYQYTNIITKTMYKSKRTRGIDSMLDLFPDETTIALTHTGNVAEITYTCTFKVPYTCTFKVWKIA